MAHVEHEQFGDTHYVNIAGTHMTESGKTVIEALGKLLFYYPASLGISLGLQREPIITDDDAELALQAAVRDWQVP